MEQMSMADRLATTIDDQLSAMIDAAADSSSEAELETVQPNPKKRKADGDTTSNAPSQSTVADAPQSDGPSSSREPDSDVEFISSKPKKRKADEHVPTCSQPEVTNVDPPVYPIYIYVVKTFINDWSNGADHWHFTDGAFRSLEEANARVQTLYEEFIEQDDIPDEWKSNAPAERKEYDGANPDFSEGDVEGPDEYVLRLRKDGGIRIGGSGLEGDTWVSWAERIVLY